MLLVLKVGTERTIALNGMFITDGFGAFMKMLVLVGSALVDRAVDRLQRAARASRASSIPCWSLLATTGMMMMISANDLISLYVGLELQSLALYVVAAFDRDTVRSTEAGLKYFVLGALASGMLLFGASMVYGFAGTTSFDVLQQALQNGGAMSLGPAHRHRVHHRRPRLQGLGGAVPHVDARRLRGRADAGDGVLRAWRPRSRRWRCSCA